MITWQDRLENLRTTLGRDPTLSEMLEEAEKHELTPEEREDQRQSWIRGILARCEHGELDFEQCPKCRGWTK